MSEIVSTHVGSHKIYHKHGYAYRFFQTEFILNAATELLAIEHYAGNNNSDYSELSVIWPNILPAWSCWHCLWRQE
jgi:hypothetical protein